MCNIFNTQIKALHSNYIFEVLQITFSKSLMMIINVWLRSLYNINNKFTALYLLFFLLLVVGWIAWLLLEKLLERVLHEFRVDRPVPLGTGCHHQSLKEVIHGNESEFLGSSWSPANEKIKKGENILVKSVIIVEFCRKNKIHTLLCCWPAFPLSNSCARILRWKQLSWSGGQSHWLWELTL